MIQPVIVNVVAIVAAAVAAMIVGFAWYSKALFGNSWMKLNGMTEASMKKNKNKMPLAMAVMVVASLVMAFVLTHSIVYAGGVTLTDGAIVGFMSWLGFVATTGATNGMFSGKPTKLIAIDLGHYLASMVVMGVVLAYFI